MKTSSAHVSCEGKARKSIGIKAPVLDDRHDRLITVSSGARVEHFGDRGGFEAEAPEFVLFGTRVE